MKKFTTLTINGARRIQKLLVASFIINLMLVVALGYMATQTV